MASPNEDESPKVVIRRTLRAVNSAAGLSGFILNTVTLVLAFNGVFHGNSVIDVTSAAYIPIIFSVAWNHLEARATRALPLEYQYATIIVDAGLFLEFLTVLVASCIIQGDLDLVRKAENMLLTFNDMPWVVCG